MKPKLLFFLLVWCIFLVIFLVVTAWERGKDAARIKVHEWEEGQEGLLNSPSDIGVTLSFPSPDEAEVTVTERIDEDYIRVDFVATDYELNRNFLMKVTVNEEVVGRVYFDREGNIRFWGDKEKFDRFMLKALKSRHEKVEK